MSIAASRRRRGMDIRRRSVYSCSTTFAPTAAIADSLLGQHLMVHLVLSSRSHAVPRKSSFLSTYKRALGQQTARRPSLPTRKKTSHSTPPPLPPWYRSDPDCPPCRTARRRGIAVVSWWSVREDMVYDCRRLNIQSRMMMTRSQAHRRQPVSLRWASGVERPLRTCWKV